MKTIAADHPAAKGEGPRAPLHGGVTKFCERTAAALGLRWGGKHLRWAVWYVIGCSGLIGGALLALWAASGFADIGLSGHGLVALILGVLLTTGLAIGLMALSFYSDRSGDDQR